MRKLYELAVAALCAAVFIALAMAFMSEASLGAADVVVQEGTNVTGYWGQFFGQVGAELVPWAATAIMGFVVILIGRFAPPWAQGLLNKQRTDALEQLLERSLGWGVSQVADQVKDQKLTVDLKNEVLAQAVTYALDHGAKTIIDFAGGQNAIPEKLVSRMPTSPAVQSVTTPTVVGLAGGPQAAT